MASPFDPFDASFDDDFSSARTIASKMSKTSKASKSSNKRRTTTKSPALEVVQEGPSSPRALPPRLVVKLALYEDISSTAIVDPNGEGGSLSQILIEGKIMAQVESSNALKSTPFSLALSGPMVSLATIKCNKHSALEDEDASVGGTIGTVRWKVNVPKSITTLTDILSYSINVRTQNMPILVQAKTALVKTKTCRISVQIRSNLSNIGDLTNFTIVVAIPPTTLLANTLTITRGDHGVWDSNKRIISWKIGALNHGESCLVSAEAEVSESIVQVMHENPFNPNRAEDRIKCPVIVRFESEVDQVSDLEMRVGELGGVPATIMEGGQVRSYRMLHRVAN
mmetsp:Transcript_13471/g.22024  ORF Transcript_13471/g.22024 Transcript_13471/m.22024 type:complete len:339 (+) Transcript_13471:79-1095(+)